MDYKWNSDFFIPLVSAVICAIQTINCNSNYPYDITKSLNSCIVDLFRNVEVDEVKKLLNNIENYKRSKFEFQIDHDKKPFHNKLHFSGINITGSRWLIHDQRPYVNCSFTDKKITLYSPKYICIIATQVGATNDSIYANFNPDLYFFNMSITVAKLPEKQNNAKQFSIIYSYDNLSFSYNQRTSFTERLTSDRQTELEKLFKKATLSLVLYNIIDNEKFSRALDENFLSQPEQTVVPSHSRFLGHEQEHFYFIPNASLYWFDLRDITVRGLWNFQSLAFTQSINNATFTLVVKDVRGSTTLDYGCQIEKPLELNFIANFIRISVDYIISQVNVEARDYHVTRTIVDTPRLTHRQATVIMRQIEAAVAASIFPTMKLWRDTNQPTSEYDTECPLEKFFAETTEKPESKAVKQFFKNWIPFNDG